MTTEDLVHEILFESIDNALAILKRLVPDHRATVVSGELVIQGPLHNVRINVNK